MGKSKKQEESKTNSLSDVFSSYSPEGEELNESTNMTELKNLQLSELSETNSNISTPRCESKICYYPFISAMIKNRIHSSKMQRVLSAISEKESCTFILNAQQIKIIQYGVDYYGETPENVKHVNCNDKELFTIQQTKTNYEEACLFVYSFEQQNLKFFECNLGQTFIFGNLEVITIEKSRLSSIEVDAANLRELHLQCNRLQNLVISQLKELVILNVKQNLLEKIDLTQNVKLQELTVSNNKFFVINTNACKQLRLLDISNNEFTDHLFKNTTLESYNCSNNELKELRLSNCRQLVELNAQNNQLKHVNLSACKKLKTINLNVNLLSKFEISGFRRLQSLLLWNNELKSIIVAKCPIIEEVIYFANPQLKYVVLHKSGNQYVDPLCYGGSNKNVKLFIGIAADTFLKERRKMQKEMAERWAQQEEIAAL